VLAKELISEVFPSIKTSESAAKALKYMEVFRVTHLPIVNNTELLGLISDTDIYDMNLADEPIGAHNLSLIRPFVYLDAHFFEVLEIVNSLNLSLIPVLDYDDNYMGAITLQDLARRFAELVGSQHPGGIIELEMHMLDYSLSEIAQIVESNDAKILGLYVTEGADTSKIIVTIKLNRTDISAILQTFDRYQYTVRGSFADNEEVDNMNSDRFEQFMNYLNI